MHDDTSKARTPQEINLELYPQNDIYSTVLQEEGLLWIEVRFEVCGELPSPPQ
ncbi:hypothetical protein [Paenibacillus sp. OV219]|uniref:hypothetical protein n=1 Tax=Paenibacillus sp. OV219 TaxID=1884377 RepID=UPI0008D0E955|nr:hypothetical protein [Paenibacillus sp. OV219]SEO65517.1 hypothetical protein SAMN05518847_109150 [Paenibacillus sp. OV219]